MNRYIFPLVFIFIFNSLSHSLLAQKVHTEAEMKKWMKMKTDIEAQLNKNPRTKGLMNTAQESPPETKKFPKPDMAALPIIKAKPMSFAALRNYLVKLNGSLQLKLNNTEKDNIKKNMGQLGNDAENLEMAALSAWYNGGINEALVLGLNACLKKPSDTLMLNNLGGLLNLDSKEIKALPILKTLAAHVEGNSMILNNLGQSYAGLGYLDSAMYYFGACLKLSPDHPEANNTAGQIEEERGNTKSALEHFENSLKGAYNEGAANALETLAPDFNLSSLVRPPVKLPYFNDDKYHLPPYCTSTAGANIIEQEEKDFDDFINPLIERYAALASEEDKLSTMEILELSKHLINNPGSLDMQYFTGPFAIYSKTYLHLYLETANRLSSYKNDFNSMEQEIRQLLEDLKNKQSEGAQEYEKAVKALPCGEGDVSGCAVAEEMAKARCKRNNALADECLIAIAAINENMEEKKLMIAREMFEDKAYFLCLSLPTKHLAQAKFYEAAKDFLATLIDIKRNRVYIYPDNCVKLQEAIPNPKSDSVLNYKCPIDIEIGFIVGKIKLNCEKFQFAIGELGRFKYEKNFNTKQSSISMGIYAGVDFPGFNFLRGGVKAEEMYYISFDANNHVTDFGISFEAKSFLKSDLGVFKVLSEGGVGYKIGVNSGWTFKSE